MSGKIQVQKKSQAPQTQAKTGLLQWKSANGHEPETVPPIVHEVLRSPGQPLDEETRAFFEPRFGHDFSQVRVHTDAKAAESARAVNALAYTVGRDMVFSAVKYPFNSRKWQRLIGHELTHVVQQRCGGHPPQLDPASSPEREAVAAAENTLNDARQVRVVAGTDVGVSRQIESSLGSSVEVRPIPQMETMGLTGRPLSKTEYDKRNAALKKTMNSLIMSGIDEAQNGRDNQQYHMENVRGVAGTLSDWWNDVIPPYIGMWSNAIGLLRRAEVLLAADDLRGAHIYLVNGYELLADAKQKWSQYMTSTVEGAETTITTLTFIRDGAFALEVGLLTGGSGLVGGGVVGSTLAGAGASVYAASKLDTPFGEATRGTLQEIRNTGAIGNLRLAASGIAGILYGTGEGLTGIAKSLANMFLHPDQFVADLLKLPSVLDTLWAHRQELWNHYSSLPPEKQAFEVGRLAGQIEAMLIAAQTTKTGGAALSEGLTFTVKVPQWVTGMCDVAAPAFIWVDHAVTINTAAMVPALNTAAALSMGGNAMAMAKSAEPKGASTGGSNRRNAPKEPRQTKAERRTQARRDSDSAQIQRENEGTKGAEETGEFGGTTVRRGSGGRQMLSEDQAVAQAAGAEFEGGMVRSFLRRQPAGSESFSSSLRNWRKLQQRYPRIAQLFSRGSRPDCVTVNPRMRTIHLFDPTSKPNPAHMEKSIEYMQRLLEDPEMQRLYGGWQVIVEERYWESGFRKPNLRLRVISERQ